MDALTKCPWDGVAATGPILRTADAAAYLGISVPGYYEKAAKGVLPSPLKIGGRASGVPRPWLDSVISHAAAGGVR
jgi:predicted DNA-binding transcriptional regulator AlpA